MRRSVHRGRSGGAAVRRVLRRSRRRSAAAARGARARPARAPASATAITARSTPAAQARIWSLREAALGLSMAMKGDAQVAVVRRGHRGRAREAARLHRALPADRRSATARSAGVYAHASVGCLHVRPVVNLKTDDGRRAVRGDRQRRRRSGARVRRRAVGRARRRPGAQPVHGEDVRPGALRGVPRRSSGRSIRTASSIPGKIVDAPPLTANLRYGAGYSTPNPATFFDYSRVRRHGRRRRDVQRPRRLPQDARRARCARRTWRRGRKRTRRAAARTCCGWRWPAGSARRASATRACTRCSTCASSAAPARPSARSASTWRASRASSSPTTGSGTARRCARACSATSHALSRWGSRFAPLSNSSPRSAPARWLNEQLLGIDRRRTPPAWARDTFAQRFARRHAGAARPRRRRAALQRHVHQLQRPRDRHGGASTCSRRPGCDVALAPHGCCGRPLISQGLLDEARDAGRAQRRRAASDRATRGEPIVFFEPSCLSAVREDAPALLRGDAQRKRASASPSACVLFEEFLERDCAGRTRCARPASRARRRSCCTATVTRRRWACCRRRRRCWRAFPARRSSISTPAAAAWPARSATRASTTRCRGRSASGGCCRPRARWTPGAVLVAAGTSCRHQVADFTGVAGAASRRCCSVRCSTRSPHEPRLSSLSPRSSSPSSSAASPS